MHVRVIVLVLTIFVAACAGNVQTLQLADSVADNLAGRQVYIVHEAIPALHAQTAAKVALIGGVIGGLAAYEAGAKIVADNEIQDPSETVENLLAQHLQDSHRTVSDVEIIEFGEKKPKDVASWPAEDRRNSLFLDVETLSWGFNYFPTAWTRYRVYYLGKVRLIDAETGEVIARYKCWDMKPETAGEAPTYDEMIDNGAAVLKAMLNEQAKACVDKVTTQIL